MTRSRSAATRVMSRTASSSGESVGSAESGSPQTLKYEPSALRRKNPGRISQPQNRASSAGERRNGVGRPKNGTMTWSSG